MRKILCLFLALVLVCSLGACKKNEIDPKPSISGENPLPTEDSEKVTMSKILEEEGAVTYYWTDRTDYEYAVTSMGFSEVCFNLGYSNFRLKNITLGEDKFKMVFDWKLVDEDTGKETWQEDWALYGAKAEMNGNISDINSLDYESSSGWDYQEELGKNFSDGYYERVDCFFFDIKGKGENEVLENVVLNAAIYFPETKNVYNITKEYGKDPLEYPTPPVVLDNRDTAKMLARKNIQGSIVDSHPVATAEFTLKYGNKEETYTFRKGMSLLAWAASEYNTGGWVAGYDNGVFSPDYKYVIWANDNDMEFMMEDSVIVANKNDLGTVPPEAMEHILAQQTTMHATVHLVNAQTPLLSPGVKIVSRHNVENGYKVFNLGTLYETDDVLKVYLKNIPDDVLENIKMYTFEEPLETRLMIHESGYTTHTQPFAKDNPVLAIPETATCIEFKRADDVTIEHEDSTVSVIDHNVAVAEYDVAADPNFTIYNEKAIVITYKDQIVYWIHMPMFLDNYEQEDLHITLEPGMTQEEIDKIIAEKEKEWEEKYGAHNHEH